MRVLVATKVTGVIASFHLTAGPVEVHHGMIGEMVGVHQHLLEERGKACLNKHILHSLATGYHPRSAK